MSSDYSNNWTVSTLTPELTSYLITFQNINITCGSFGIIINIILIIILLSSEFFRCYRRLILFLAIGDLCNCFYVFMEGFERKEIYLNFFLTGKVTNETYWTCALKIFDWMGLLGALIPHIVTFFMGIERLIAFKYLKLYKKYFSNGDGIACIFCLIYVFINIIIAFTLAFINKDKPSRYFCGRKVSYTHIYISFIYGMSVFGYVSCFLITFSLMIYLKFFIRVDRKVRTIYKKNTCQSQDIMRYTKSYQRIKQVVIISFISSITISLPNFISFASVVIGPLDSGIADPADWMSVFKSSINLFVYIALNKEFQHSIKKLHEYIRQLYI